MAVTNTPGKSEMKACPSIDVRASILTTIKANREAGESQEVLARDLTTLFHKLFDLSRPPADQVPDMVEALELLMFAAGRLIVATDGMEQVRAERQAASEAMTEGLAALQAVPAASGEEWQPIESAPKDGKLVVLWQREHGLHVARWSDAFGDWHGTDWEHTPALDPTHWMRPEPPALKAQETGE